MEKKLECILCDKVFGDHRFVRSNGNIDVLFNRDECLISKKEERLFFSLDRLENEREAEITEEYIRNFKQNSFRLPFVREIKNEEWQILFYQSEKGYVLICFDKDQRFFAPFKYAIVRPFGEEQFKQSLEFEDSVFIKVAKEWRDALEEKIQEELEKKKRIRLYAGRRSIEKSVEVSGDFEFECLKCGETIFEEYDTRSSGKAICGNCGAVINISAEAEVEIRISLEESNENQK